MHGFVSRKKAGAAHTHQPPLSRRPTQCIAVPRDAGSQAPDPGRSFRARVSRPTIIRVRPTRACIVRVGLLTMHFHLSACGPGNRPAPEKERRISRSAAFGEGRGQCRGNDDEPLIDGTVMMCVWTLASTNLCVDLYVGLLRLHIFGGSSWF
jgi:hypothetical protein